ncbi:MAG: hypothetical protein ACI9GW_001970 [Halieaceae bacterium]|jgi:hypothetical protein
MSGTDVTPKPPIPDEYLGDGVYASCDGYHIILDLRGQDSTTRIAVEPAVLEALDRYRERAFPDDL